MIVHDKYSISLNRLSILLETGKKKYLLKYPVLPTFLLNRSYEKFMHEFRQLFNQEDVNKLFENILRQRRLWNKVHNLLPALYNGLKYTEHPRFKELFYETYRRKYTGEKDLITIEREIDKLRTKIEEINVMQKGNESEDESGSFEDVITYVESVLERNIDRGMKLYQFKYQYDLAVQKAKEARKLQSKYGRH